MAHRQPYCSKLRSPALLESPTLAIERCNPLFGRARFHDHSAWPLNCPLGRGVRQVLHQQQYSGTIPAGQIAAAVVSALKALYPPHPLGRRAGAVPALAISDRAVRLVASWAWRIGLSRVIATRQTPRCPRDNGGSRLVR
jgi:hypothetical protein